MQAYGIEWVIEPDLGLPIPAEGARGKGAAGPEGEWRVSLSGGGAGLVEDLGWRNGNEALDPVFLVARAGCWNWLRFPGECDFRIDLGGRSIVCYPTEGLGPASLGHLLLHQVMPRVVAQAGGTVLHASAVGWEAMAAGFCGPSGAGKSSLAAALCEAGATLVSDDCLVVQASGEGRVLALPSYPELRLWPGTPFGRGGQGVVNAGGKLVLGGDALPFTFLDGAVPLSALFEVVPEGCPEVELTALGATEAFRVVASNCFRLDAGDRARIEQEFQEIGGLVERLPVYRLGYPRRWSAMPEVIEVIEGVLVGLLGNGQR